MPPAEQKRVKDLRVQEISFVDDPAVPKAKWVIMKRNAEGGEMAEKCAKCGQKSVRIEADLDDFIMPEDGESMEAFLGRLTKSLHVALKIVGEYIQKAEHYGKPGECPEGMSWDEKAGKCVAGQNISPEAKQKEGYSCPEGHEWDEKEGKCVAKKAKEGYSCPEGHEWDEKEGKCVPEAKKAKEPEKKQKECPDKMEWNDKAGKCMPIPPSKEGKQKECPEGQMWDEKEGKCMPEAKKGDERDYGYKKPGDYGYKEPEKKQKEGYSCPEGHEWDEKEGKCMPMKEAKAAEGGKDKTPKDAEKYPNPMAKAAEEVQLSPEEEQRIKALLGQ